MSPIHRRPSTFIFLTAAIAACSRWIFSTMPPGDMRINACAMVRADRATDFSQIFSLHPELKARSMDWQPLMAPCTTSPLVFRKPTPVRNGMLLVGDAAGFVDPFVGDGISLALRSGAMAAECLASSCRELSPHARTCSVATSGNWDPSSVRHLHCDGYWRCRLRCEGQGWLFHQSSRLKDFVVSRTRRAS